MAVVLPTNVSVLGHIFREDEGHVPDTPENRELLLAVANDPGSRVGGDQYGNEWFARLLEDGRQVWTQARNGRMIDGGVNHVTRFYDQETGLKRP